MLWPTERTPILNLAISPSILLTLDNCDREPIHIPGLIQPHGALMAFAESARLVFVSDNAEENLGLLPVLGSGFEEQSLPAEVTQKIGLWFLDQAKTFALHDVRIGETQFNVVGHRNDQNIMIVEFERMSDLAVAPDASFAMLIHRAMERFKRQTDIDDLLGMVSAEVRSITGFDRVMAYRFRPDDSGEVVRESRKAGLDSWQGHRYPSTDIPAQARRLFIANPLRLIADVRATSAGVISSRDETVAPLDMSFCVLRSVSPVHIEYLTNMGVAASLCVSIVIDGKLWGMIACHHGSARQVPHGIRLVCEVLAQMISVTVASLQTTKTLAKVAKATAALGEIAMRARAADDLLHGLSHGHPNPGDLVSADVTLCFWGGSAAFCQGSLSAEAVAGLSRILDDQTQEIFTSSHLIDEHPALAAVLAPYCGIHAVCFDVGRRGWVVWLRSEQIEHVRWAGKPHKEVTVGPYGPRLTPRGSFLEWREEVRGISVAWDESDRKTAKALRAELNRIAGAHAMDMERARHQLLAALGHDLREPLHSISLAAQVLKARGETDISSRITTTSSRMARLVVQIMDMSRLQSDRGIVLDCTLFDLSALLKECVDDANFSYPGSDAQLACPMRLMINADRDRLSQVMSNLLSNARHHGTPNRPIIVFAREEEGRVSFGVTNGGKAIPAKAQVDLFKALKPTLGVNPRNRTGLGLGLYIAYEIVKAHQGKLTLACANELITFTASFPRLDEVGAS